MKYIHNAKGLKAEGYESTSGFVVCEGSQAALEAVPPMKAHVRGIFEIREKLISTGVLSSADDSYRFPASTLILFLYTEFAKSGDQDIIAG